MGRLALGDVVRPLRSTAEGSGVRMIPILGLTLVLAAPAGAQVGPAAGEGGLTPLADAAGQGWEAVGRIDIGGAVFCTGSLIREDLVLTAAHCLYGAGGRPVPAGEIRFLAGWRDGEAEAVRAVSRTAIAPAFDPSLGETAANVPGDVAVLRLSEPIRGSTAIPYSVGRPAREGDVVAVVSYAAGRSEVASLEEGCSVLHADGGVLVTSCEAGHGASGAPILTLGEGEAGAGTGARIVSVISARAMADGRPVALGADLGRVLEPLIARIDAEGDPAGEGGARGPGGAKFVRP